MAHWYLDDDGLLALWSKIKERSLPVREITKSEYNALDEDEKSRDVIYLIIDDNSNSSSSGGPCKADECEFDPGDTGMESDNVQNAIYELFTSGSEAKKLIASAITAKGVNTAEDATWETMRDNILAISTEYDWTYKAGVDWWSSNTLTNSSLKEVAYGNGIFLAISQYTANFFYSSNGLNWLEVKAPSSSLWNDIAFVNGIFFVSLANSNSLFYTTDAGKTWEKKTLPLTLRWTRIMSDNAGRIVLVANGTTSSIYSINGGSTWETAELPVSFSSCSGLAYGNKTFACAGVGNQIAYSTTDKIKWLSGTIPDSFKSITWGDMTYSQEKNMFVLVGSGGAILYSFNGQKWEEASSPSSINLFSVAYGNNKFVAIGSGEALYSEDGIHWNKANKFPLSGTLGGITYGNNKFVAVANSSAKISISFNTDNTPEQLTMTVSEKIKSMEDFPNATSGQTFERIQ